MATSWTDHPVNKNVPIKARHMNELTSAITGAGYTPPGGWTDHPVTVNTPIKARHFNERRDGIRQLWLSKGMGEPPNWTAGSPPGTTRPIMASDMNDLRHWFNLYEANGTPLDPQPFMGTNYPIVHGNMGDPGYWDNIIIPNLKDLRAQWLRLPFKAEANGQIDYTGKYDVAVQKLNAAEISILGLVYSESVGDDICGVNAPLDPPGFLNQYIVNFRARTDQAARRYTAGSAYGQIMAWEIWNEPNDSSALWFAPGCAGQYDQVYSDRFAKLLTECYLAIKDPNNLPGSANPNATVLFGGLLYNLNPDKPHQHHHTYLNNVMNDSVMDWYHGYTGDPNAYPFDGVAFHPYGETWEILPAYGQLRTVLVNHSRPDIHLWLTEKGWSMADNTEQQQADKLEQSYHDSHGTGYIDHDFWFTFADFDQTFHGRMGLTTLDAQQRVNYRRKSYYRYQDLAFGSIPL